MRIDLCHTQSAFEMCPWPKMRYNRLEYGHSCIHSDSEDCCLDLPELNEIDQFDLDEIEKLLSRAADVLCENPELLDLKIETSIKALKQEKRVMDAWIAGFTYSGNRFLEKSDPDKFLTQNEIIGFARDYLEALNQEKHNE